jgi:hypothetical protein
LQGSKILHVTKILGFHSKRQDKTMTLFDIQGGYFQRSA